MIFKFDTALVLAPHTDDGEFGCGGTLARLIDQGTDVHYIAFSICEDSVPSEFPPDILATEIECATQKLNIHSSNLMVHRYPVRNFHNHRQEILEMLVSVRRELTPDLVLLPATVDVHQDHQVITAEGIRAFKHATILGYELPWNNFQFNHGALVSLAEKYIIQKIEALQQYKSQAHRSYAQKEFIESLARVRGQQANTLYAEAFEVIRWIIR